ncbi:MAG: prolipoprotein diacylglyceryl transferase [Clostridia bacterium]|nr:prolipoprotein diacylglyceryl transferase [Clostridia bacterium]
MDDMMHVLFSVAGLPVTTYALCVVIALALGLLLLAWRQKKHGLRCDTAEIFALLALPLGLIGARLFYCLARLTMYMEMGLVSILRFWDGGYALWGAVGGAVIAAILTAKITKQSALKLLDALSAPAALVIALGRLAELTNGEGRGLEVITPVFQRFPFALYNADYETWFWAICVFEAVAALVIFAILLAKKPARDGEHARLFLILYCASQILLEALRADNFLHWTRVFIRVSQLTAVLVLAGMMFCALWRWRKASADARLPRKQVIINWVIFLICVGVSIWMQFAVQKSAHIPAWLCYTVMGVCAVGFGVTSHRLIMKNVRE